MLLFLSSGKDSGWQLEISCSNNLLNNYEPGFLGTAFANVHTAFVVKQMSYL
jgi:hypothetical protein